VGWLWVVRARSDLEWAGWKAVVCVFVRGAHVLRAPYTGDSSGHHSVETASTSKEKQTYTTQEVFLQVELANRGLVRLNCPQDLYSSTM
jgi:hypothetical protein